MILSGTQILHQTPYNLYFLMRPEPREAEHSKSLQCKPCRNKLEMEKVNRAWNKTMAMETKKDKCNKPS